MAKLSIHVLDKVDRGQDDQRRYVLELDVDYDETTILDLKKMVSGERGVPVIEQDAKGTGQSYHDNSKLAHTLINHFHAVNIVLDPPHLDVLHNMNSEEVKFKWRIHSVNMNFKYKSIQIVLIDNFDDAYSSFEELMQNEETQSMYLSLVAVNSSDLNKAWKRRIPDSIQGKNAILYTHPSAHDLEFKIRFCPVLTMYKNVDDYDTFLRARGVEIIAGDYSEIIQSNQYNEKIEEMEQCFANNFKARNIKSAELESTVLEPTELEEPAKLEPEEPSSGFRP